MRLWVFSDLHLEMTSSTEAFPIPDADVCVCAGDITDRGPARAIEWLGRNISSRMPVVFVAGNHEYYRTDIISSLEKAKGVAKLFSGVHFLNDGEVVINGYRFVGSTLWTDFKLYENPEMAMVGANLSINDFKRIKWQSKPFRRFHPLDSLRLHNV